MMNYHNSPVSSSPTSSDTDAASSADAANPNIVHAAARARNSTTASTAFGANQSSSFHRRPTTTLSPFRHAGFNVKTGTGIRTTRPYRATTVNHYRNSNSSDKLRLNLPFDESPPSPQSNDPHEEEDEQDLLPSMPLSPANTFRSSTSHISRRTSPNLFGQYERTKPKTTFTPYQRVGTDAQRAQSRLPMANRRFNPRPLPLHNRENENNEDALTKLDSMEATLRRRASSNSKIGRRPIVANRNTKSMRDVHDDQSQCPDDSNSNPKLRRFGTESRITTTTNANTTVPLGSSFHRTASSRSFGRVPGTAGGSSGTLRRTRPSLQHILGRNGENGQDLLHGPMPLPRRGSLERLPPLIPRNSSAARDIRQGADSVKAQLSSMFVGMADVEDVQDGAIIHHNSHSHSGNLSTVRRASVCSVPSQAPSGMRPRLTKFRNAAIKGTSSFGLRRRRDDSDNESVVDFPSTRSLHRTFSGNGSVRSTVVGR